MKYWIRCWNPQSQQTENKTFSLNEIINDAQKNHMNMIDVGIVLLNAERQKHGLEKISTGAIAGENLGTEVA